MINKLFVICAVFALQVFAPEARILEVRKISGNTFDLELPPDATIAEVCAQVSAKADIHPNLTKVLLGKVVLNPKSTDPLPIDITSVDLVTLVSDCIVEFAEKSIIVTSSKFPSDLSINKDYPDYGCKEFDEEFKSTIAEGPNLLKNFLSCLLTYSGGLSRSRFVYERFLSLNFKLYGQMSERIVLSIEAGLEDLLLFAVCYKEWFEERIDRKVLGSHTIRFFDELLSSLESSSYPELDKLREKIYSRALERFPSETSGTLELKPGRVREEEFIELLRELKLLS